MEDIIIKSLNDLSGFKRNGCYQCIHRRGVPGSAHSSCAKYKAFIEADDHGIRNGWVMFPFDFDPTWINSCDSFISKEKEIELTRKDLLIKVFSMSIKILPQNSISTQSVVLILILFS